MLADAGEHFGWRGNILDQNLHYFAAFSFCLKIMLFLKVFRREEVELCHQKQQFRLNGGSKSQEKHQYYPGFEIWLFIILFLYLNKDVFKIWVYEHLSQFFKMLNLRVLGNIL